MSNELERLASGVGDRMKSGTINILFILKQQVSTVIKATYVNSVCDNKALKYDPYYV